MPATKSPGPASFGMRTLVGYINHDVNSKKARAPNWSMGSKPTTKIENKSPGPASVGIEKFTRNGKIYSPAYSLYCKTKELKLDHNPGPAAHSPVDTTLFKWPLSPKFTTAGNQKFWNNEGGPGPSAQPTPLDNFKVKAPKFALGLKTKELALDKGPGSNAYDIRKPVLQTMKSFPCYSLHMKTKDPLQNKDKKPGSNQYGLSAHNPFDKGPSFTLRQRHTEFSHCPVISGDNC